MADGGQGGGFLNLAAGNGGAPAVVADQDVAPALLAVVGVQGPPPPAPPLGGDGGLQALALPADVGVQGPPPPLGGHGGQALALPAGVGVQGPAPPAAPFGGDGGQALALQAGGPPPPALGQQQPGVGIGDMTLGELAELEDVAPAPPLGGHGGGLALGLHAVVGVQGPPPPGLALPAVVGVQGPPPPLGGYGGLQDLALPSVVGAQGPPPPALGQQQPGVGIGDMALGELLELAELADTLDEPEASVTTAEAREQLSRMVEKMKHVMEQTTPEMPMVVNPPPPPVVVRQSGDTPLCAAGDIPPATPAHMIPNQSAPPAYVIRHSASIPPFEMPMVVNPPPPGVVRQSGDTPLLAAGDIPPATPAHIIANQSAPPAYVIRHSVSIPPFIPDPPPVPPPVVPPPLVAAAAGSDDPMPPQFAGMVLPAIKNPRPLQICKACGERLQWLNKNHGDTKPPNPLKPHFCLCEPCQKSEKTRVEFCGDCGAYDARINPKPPGNL